MNLWIIAAIVVGILAITGIAVASLGVAKEPETIECENCNNGCNAERNCGRTTCGAVSGGSCGCRG